MEIVFLIIVAVAAFILLREFFCWYFKINERKDLLIQIRDELRSANEYEEDKAPVTVIQNQLSRKKGLFGGMK